MIINDKMVRIKKKCDGCKNKFNHVIVSKHGVFCKHCIKKKEFAISNIPKDFGTNYTFKMNFKNKIRFFEICKEFKVKPCFILNKFIEGVINNEYKLG